MSHGFQNTEPYDIRLLLGWDFRYILPREFNDMYDMWYTLLVFYTYVDHLKLTFF